MKLNLYLLLQKVNTFIVVRKWHFAFWFFYMATAVGINRWMYPGANPLGILIIHFLLIVFFYCVVPTIELLRDGKRRKKGVFRGILLLSVMVLVGWLVSEILLPRSGAGIRRTEAAFVLTQFLQYVVLMSLRGTQYALTYVYFRRELALKDQNVLLQEQQLNSERLMRAKELARLKEVEERNRYMLRYLTAQIQPHLLYNCFSLLQARALAHGDEQLGEAVTIMAGILSYGQQCARDDVAQVLLRRELDQLEDMLSLVRMKWDDNAQVVFKITGRTQGLTIPPFTLLTFLENALKYGQLGPVHPIEMTVHAAARRLHFTCRNKKRKHIAKEKGSGLGIKNVHKRLSALFPGHFALQTDDGDTHFSVTLTIDYPSHEEKENNQVHGY